MGVYESMCVKVYVYVPVVWPSGVIEHTSIWISNNLPSSFVRPWITTLIFRFSKEVRSWERDETDVSIGVYIHLHTNAIDSASQVDALYIALVWLVWKNWCGCNHCLIAIRSAQLLPSYIFLCSVLTNTHTWSSALFKMKNVLLKREGLAVTLTND